MEPQLAFVNGRTYAIGDPALQAALAAIHDTPERPRCLCVRGGVEMYTARHRLYVVKRMPGTGPRHHPTCPSFEPEAGSSGLDELRGRSVIEHAPDAVELQVGFPMSRRPGRGRSHEVTDEPIDQRTSRQRMSLLAVLHYLYERAGFNRWYPAMEGRRGQGALCKYLTEAAEELRIKGQTLADRLYVPEPYNPQARGEIAERRRRKLAVLQSAGDDGQPPMALASASSRASRAPPSGTRSGCCTCLTFRSSSSTSHETGSSAGTASCSRHATRSSEPGAARTKRPEANAYESIRYACSPSRRARSPGTR
jgi:hypothetical protein